MAAYLVKLTLNNKFNVTAKTGERITGTDFTSDEGLSAHIVLHADPEDPELEDLGLVHVHVEAQPRNLPAMTPEKTLAWLRFALQRML